MSDHRPDIHKWLTTIGWTRPMLATMSGRNRQTIWRWCKGINCPPWAISHWLEDLARYHEAHPPPPLFDRNGRERIKRQPHVPELAQEQHRDPGLVPSDAQHHAPVPLSSPVPDPEGIPSGWYRPPGA